MGKKTRYSDADKATALAALDANGGNVARTARQTKVPRGTLQDWIAGRVSDDVPEIRQVKKSDLAARFDSFVGRVLDLTTDEDIKAAPLEKRFTAAGIAIDKARLLRGESTTINEQRSSERRTYLVALFGAAGPPGDAALTGGQPVHPAHADGAAT